MADVANAKQTRKKILSCYDEVVGVIAAIDDNLTDHRYDVAIANVDQLIDDCLRLRVALERTVTKVPNQN